MANEVEKIATLEKSVADLTKANADLTVKVTGMEAMAKAKDIEIADLKKAKDEASKDEVINIDGAEIRKSKVGEEVFMALKASDARATKAEDARELIELEKRADKELPMLPGTSVAKAKVLKGIAQLEEETRKTLTEMLKSGNEAMKSRMTELGGAGNGSIDLQSPSGQLNKLVEDYATKNNVDRFKATAEVTKSVEGARLYNQVESEKRRRQEAAMA